MTTKKYDAINLDYLELMADGDISMKKIMLDMLLEELPVEIEKMKALLQEGNWTELGNVSHKMKSTLAYVGNDEMTVANKTIETICKTGEAIDELPALMDNLIGNFELVLPELKDANDSI